MKRTAITASLLIALLFAIPAYALEPLHYSEKPITERSSEKGKYFTWDETNTKLHIPLTLLMAIDLGQTLYIADNCTPDVFGSYKESENNIFLSKCPTRTEVKQYFGWSYLALTGMTFVLRDNWSYGLQGSAITVQILVTGDNFSVNVGLGF